MLARDGYYARAQVGPLETKSALVYSRVANVAEQPFEHDLRIVLHRQPLRGRTEGNGAAEAAAVDRAHRDPPGHAHPRTPPGGAAGTVGGDELLRTIRAVVHDTRWQPGSSVLWECSAIRELLLDTEHYVGMGTLGSAYHDRLGSGKTAIVVQRELDRIVADAYVALTRGTLRQRRVFLHAKDAIDWLDGEADPEAQR